jgi:hypothetical protein
MIGKCIGIKDVENELLISNLDAIDYGAHVLFNGHSVGEH